MMIIPHPIMAKYYSLVPLPQGRFEGLSLLDRAVFGLIYERWRLSEYNVLGTPGDSPWYDYEEDAVFCMFSHNELSRLIGTSEKTIRRSLALLRDKHRMISWKKASFMGACRYYIASDMVQEMAALRQDSKKERPCP